MENFNSECKAIKEMIEFEMKTTEDYISNMDLEDKLEDRLKALQVNMLFYLRLVKCLPNLLFSFTLGRS